MSKKVLGCKTCETMRCCPDHCCNWDNCKCGDCNMCGGSLPVEYTRLELDRKRAEQKQKEDEEKQKKLDALKRVEDEKRRQKEEKERKAQEEFEMKFKVELEKAREIQRQRELAKKQELEEGKRRHREMLDMIEKTQTDTKATLSRVTTTITNMDNCLAGVRETNQRYEEFKDAFGEVMKLMVERMSNHLKPPHKQMGVNPGLMPKRSNVKEVAELMMNKQEIVILTGAGLSAASGIPTFRGEGGFWTLRNQNEKVKAEDFLKYSYFQEHPEEIWRWHHHLRKMCATRKPNKAHRALAAMQVFAKENDINLSLVTQNVDGYHVDAYYDAVKSSSRYYNEETKETKISDPETPGYGFCNNVLEIHGNIFYMRCVKGCCKNLFSSPPIGCNETFIPKCPKCGSIAKSHTLLFDQAYDEEYFRRDTVLNRCALADCLIVVGSTLTTGLPIKIISQAIENNALIIEINPEPVIENGNVRQLVGDAEILVPEMCQAIKESFVKTYGKADPQPLPKKAVIAPVQSAQTKPSRPSTNNSHPPSPAKTTKPTNSNANTPPKTAATSNIKSSPAPQNRTYQKPLSPQKPSHSKSNSISMSNSNPPGQFSITNNQSKTIQANNNINASQNLNSSQLSNSSRINSPNVRAPARAQNSLLTSSMQAWKRNSNGFSPNKSITLPNINKSQQKNQNITITIQNNAKNNNNNTLKVPKQEEFKNLLLTEAKTTTNSTPVPGNKAQSPKDTATKAAGSVNTQSQRKLQTAVEITQSGSKHISNDSTSSANSNFQPVIKDSTSSSSLGQETFSPEPKAQINIIPVEENNDENQSQSNLEDDLPRELVRNTVTGVLTSNCYEEEEEEEEESVHITEEIIERRSNVRRSMSPKKMLVNPGAINIENTDEFTYLNPNISTADKEVDNVPIGPKVFTNNPLMSRTSYMSNTYSHTVSSNARNTSINGKVVQNSSSSNASSPSKKGGAKRTQSKKHGSPQKKAAGLKKKK